MIDLHIHTKYSDGTDEVVEVLKKAENYKLDVISITDHNTCRAYNELETIPVEKYYSGKIIKGVELNTKLLGIPIEILGYGIDKDIMNEITSKEYLTPQKRNMIEMEKIYEKCKKANIDLGENVLENYDANMFTSKYLHSLITKKEENKKYIDDETWGNSILFYRKYMSNPESLFYVDMDEYLPSLEKTMEFVREAGGLVFIPHIFEYKENSLRLLEEILENYKIDGIECYYTTFTEEQRNHLLNICKEKNLFISGGSDYHRKS